MPESTLLEAIFHRLDKLEQLLTGNGSPENGLLMKVGRIEQKLLERQRTRAMLWTLLVAVGSSFVTAAVGQLF